MTVDHYQPRSREGPDTPDNLVYACMVCNDFKGDYWQPDSTRRILHPLLEQLSDHVREEVDGVLVPLTETGRFHVERLQLNRPQLLLQRQRNRQIRLLQQRLAELEEENAALLRQIRAVEADVRSLMEQADREMEP